MKQTIIITIVLFCLLGCNKKKYESIPHGYYTFEVENWAWGHQHNGWIIDADGNVMSFNLPANWKRPDSLGFISEEDILDNLSKCKNKIKNITARKLYENNKLLEGAAIGSFSEKENTANDMGWIQYSCYQFDVEKGLYKKIKLHVEGDWSFHNESNEAKEITAWMKKIE